MLAPIASPMIPPVSARDMEIFIRYLIKSSDGLTKLVKECYWYHLVQN